MCQYVSSSMRMNASAGRGTGAASSCPARGNNSASHTALILDTMVMVSFFAVLGVVELVLAVFLLLAGALLITLARIIRAEAPKRRLLTI